MDARVAHLEATPQSLARWGALALSLSLAACATRGSLIPPNDVVIIDVPDVPPDVPPLGPPCRPITIPPRTEPCAGRPDCGLPSQTRVSVTGARGVLTDFQVQVTLPMAVRMAAGPACDRLAFRTNNAVWAPHFVTDCAMGTVWVRVPRIDPAGTTLTLYYGGSTAVPAAQSYDDTFDRVPSTAPGIVAAYSFDEGTGTRACPSAGTVPFDAYVHDDPVSRGMSREIDRAPELWSRDAAPSILAPTNAAAHFSRGQTSLNFPRMEARINGQMMTTRLVNWRSERNAPFTALEMQLTVGTWVYNETPANEFNDNFQTVVCFGMPQRPTPPYPGAVLDGISIFNAWAIFFRSDDANNSFLQGNTCVYPCINVDQYAHISTRMPFTRETFTRKWHFVGFTFDATTRPHATRRSYYDGTAYEFPRELDLWPQERYCPMGVCGYPPDTGIKYYDAPVVIGADLNAGEAQLGLEGRIDDMFIFGRSLPPEEMRAYREHRAYSADPIMVTVM